MRATRCVGLVVLGIAVITLFWLARERGLPAADPAKPVIPAESQTPPGDEAAGPFPGEGLMLEYASEATEPIEDLIALHRVIRGYFSIVKDQEKYPIGGNEDLAAALRGENAYKEVFLPDSHPAFDAAGRLVDRWGTPVFVHPEAAQAIELRSAGPDRRLFTDDDLELSADGLPR